MNQDKQEDKHPARTKLQAMSRKLPGALWASFDEARRNSPPDRQYEYIGKTEADLVIIEALGADRVERLARHSATQAGNALTTLHTLATWRISQGIYRFDDHLYSCMVDSALDGDIPADIFLRLPEWCVFVETPGLTFEFNNGSKSPIAGVWARVEAMIGVDDKTLVIQPLLEGVPDDVFLHAIRLPTSGRIDQWDDEAIKSTAEFRRKWGQTVDEDTLERATSRLKVWRDQVTNLLLYICSENSEIGDGGDRPTSPTPTRTKKGLRYFPPNLPTRWDVGVRLGAALNRARQNADASAGESRATVRPHIRRAHWHGVRVGPMKRADGTSILSHERRFELRWMPPIAVKVSNIDELPATIRPVLA